MFSCASVVSAYTADPAVIPNSMLPGCTTLGTRKSLCENGQNTTCECNVGIDWTFVIHNSSEVRRDDLIALPFCKETFDSAWTCCTWVFPVLCSVAHYMMRSHLLMDVCFLVWQLSCHSLKAVVVRGKCRCSCELIGSEKVGWADKMLCKAAI